MSTRARRVSVAAALAICCSALSPAASPAGVRQADQRLDRAIQQLIRQPDGPHGVSVTVQRGRSPRFHSFGRADANRPGAIKPSQQMRIASVTKAVTGAVALRLVEKGKLRLESTIGELRPDLPLLWAPITLRQLLYHTSGLPNYTATPGWQAYLGANLKTFQTPLFAISYVTGEELDFAPGTDFAYSNTDNIVIGLMAEAATGKSIQRLLRDLVFRPLKMRESSLPTGFELPKPFVRGYVWAGPGAPQEDVSQEISVSGVWAAGAIVSTQADLNRFVRAFGGGPLFTSRKLRRAQTAFLPPFSGGEPPGPGENRGGLTLYRYRTKCGILYGHTGNFPGYTQFIASSPDGSRSTVVSANLQLDIATGPPGVFTQLRKIYVRAACAALAR